MIFVANRLCTYFFVTLNQGIWDVTIFVDFFEKIILEGAIGYQARFRKMRLKNIGGVTFYLGDVYDDDVC